MKFIVFWEYSVEDMYGVIAKLLKWTEVLKKEPEKHVKYVFPPHQLSIVNEKGTAKGITIFEADNEENLIEYVMNHLPEIKVRIVPLMDVAKGMERYIKVKK